MSLPAPRGGQAPGGGGTPGKDRAARRRVRSGEDFDIIIGFLGFWTVVVLAVTVWTEITGQPALGWALGLLGLLLALYGMLRLRKRLPQRTATRHN